MPKARSRLTKLAITAALWTLLAFNGAGSADPLRLPEPVLPEGLKPYTNTDTLTRAAAFVADQVARASLQKGDERCVSNDDHSCHYDEAPLPELRINEKKGVLELVASPCESDLEVQAIHRGWARIATAYRLFAEFVERPKPTASSDSPMPREGSTVEFQIARFGRTALVRALTSRQIAHVAEAALSADHLPIQARAEVVAFLKTLLAFKSYHDLLVSKGDSIRAWMTHDQLFRTVGEASTALVTRINALLPAQAPRVNSCFAGYWEHTLVLMNGRKVFSNAIYSGGIAMYSVGFWWRREGEGTTTLAEAVLRYAIDRLQ